MQIKKSMGVIVALLAVIAVLCGYIIYSQVSARKAAEAAASLAAATKSIDTNQGEYVKPETPIDRSKNVTLPGWGSFTIPANTATIKQGFEFHNPEENLWFEDWVSIDGKQLEKLVVDSGNQTELSHYLKLAGMNTTVSAVTDYDADVFAIAQDDAGEYTVEAISGFTGTKTITVQTANGQSVELSVTCKEECYYITFGLYLEENDECLYQSDLVSPGMYIQQMDLARALAPGEYDAYVVCQPYRSDRVTKTNSGIVKLTLIVK